MTRNYSVELRAIKHLYAKPLLRGFYLKSYSQKMTKKGINLTYNQQLTKNARM